MYDFQQLLGMSFLPLWGLEVQSLAPGRALGWVYEIEAWMLEPRCLGKEIVPDECKPTVINQSKA